MLSESDFKAVVENAPLFAIDLVVLNDKHELLIGLRKNAPAKGYWFVPGGRVFKGESQQEAFARITKQELGCAFNLSEAQLLGVFDHFYEDSVFGNDVSTHYINTPYLILLKEQGLQLPVEQHSNYKWESLQGVVEDNSVHSFSKVFLSVLNKHLSVEPGKFDA